MKAATGVRAMDVAKRLIDLGFHPSTVYFPLVVDEALMVEPTETEIEGDARGVRRRAPPGGRGGSTDPELLHEAPVTTPVRRLDEARAAGTSSSVGVAGHAGLTPSGRGSTGDDPFAYRVTKDGRVRIDRGAHGDSGRREGAIDQATRLATADPEAAQQLLAPATGNSRGGNDGRGVGPCRPSTRLHNVHYRAFGGVHVRARCRNRAFTPHIVTSHSASTTIRAEIFECPCSRSRNVIGTSATA